MENFSENYKKGRIVINSGKGSSSSGGLGHAAIMCEDRFDPKWKTNGLAMTTYSVWPKKGSVSGQVTWSDKLNRTGGGVQKEPIGYWVGDKDFCAPLVSIYDVIDSDKELATDEECTSAGDNAANYKSYKYHILAGKYSSNKYMTCSKLTWKCWYDVDNTKYNLVSDKTAEYYVKPVHLANSSQTKLVVSVK